MIITCVLHFLVYIKRVSKFNYRGICICEVWTSDTKMSNRGNPKRIHEIKKTLFSSKSQVYKILCLVDAFVRIRELNAKSKGIKLEASDLQHCTRLTNEGIHV